MVPPLKGVALGPLDPGNVRGIEAHRAERGERGGTPPHCSGREREPSPLFGVGGGSSGVVSGSPGGTFRKVPGKVAASLRGRVDTHIWAGSARPLTRRPRRRRHKSTSSSSSMGSASSRRKFPYGPKAD